jgi:hypothetical protein
MQIEPVIIWCRISCLPVSYPKYGDQINSTTILLVVLYACEIWSLTLGKEHWLRVFEKMVLKKMLGPEREEVTEEWRRLHKKELYDLYSSSNVTWVI